MGAAFKPADALHNLSRKNARQCIFHCPRERFGDAIKATTWEYAENDRARAELATTGLIKVVTGKRGRVLGDRSARRR